MSTKTILTGNILSKTLRVSIDHQTQILIEMNYLTK